MSALPLGERELVITCSYLSPRDLGALAGTCRRLRAACAGQFILEAVIESAVLAQLPAPRPRAALMARHPSLAFSLKLRQAAREASVAFRHALGDREARRLGALVAANARLEYLRLFKGELSPAGARALVEGVARARGLRELQLWGCERVPAALVAPALACASLRVLSLHHNAVDDDGAAALCAALAASPLEALYLGNNRIGDAGAARIAAALARNARLAQLGLSFNRIGDDGAIALAALIRANAALKSLYLSWNRIGDAGCRALLAALDGNHTLAQLLLTGNQLDVALGLVIEEATRIPRRRIAQKPVAVDVAA